MKILIYNYADYPYFLTEVIRLSKEKYKHIDWSAIVLSENFTKLYEKLIGKENTFYIHPELNKLMKRKNIDLDIFINYPDSIYKALHADKGEGKLRRMSREYQIRYASNIYLIYKKILSKIKPDFIFFSIIESPDGVILYNLCRECNIEPIVYVWARNFGVSFFTSSINEKLPNFIKFIKPDNQIKEKAVEFIENFRKSFIPPNYFSSEPEEIINLNTPNLFNKAFKYFIRVLTRKEIHNISDKGFLGKVMTNYQPLTRRLRKIKDILINRRYFDIKDFSQIPENFIYFPLQVTPESSVNTLSPYFVDQTRAIDLILENMPSKFYLLVKEHPAMAGIREFSFYKKLRKKAGVLIADYRLHNFELIKKAICTISVTGTACLEAFLLGRPSIHLGETFFSDWIYKFDSFYNFKDVVYEAINKKEIDFEKIVDLTSKIFSIGYDFVLFSPGDPGLNPYWVMNKKNVENFLDALLDYTEKVKLFKEKS